MTQSSCSTSQFVVMCHHYCDDMFRCLPSDSVQAYLNPGSVNGYCAIAFVQQGAFEAVLIVVFDKKHEEMNEVKRSFPIVYFCSLMQNLIFFQCCTRNKSASPTKVDESPHKSTKDDNCQLLFGCVFANRAKVQTRNPNIF